MSNSQEKDPKAEQERRGDPDRNRDKRDHEEDRGRPVKPHRSSAGIFKPITKVR